MKYTPHAKIILLAAIAFLTCAHFSPMQAQGQKKQAWNAKGTMVEGCSCSIPCACEIFGLEMGCSGVGAMELTGGEFKGVSLAGGILGQGGVSQTGEDFHRGQGRKIHRSGG
jgi:hypothetical protein